MQIKCKYCGTRFDTKDKYCPYCYARANEKKRYHEDDEVKQVANVQTRTVNKYRNRQGKRGNTKRHHSKNALESKVNKLIMVMVVVWIFLIIISIISNIAFLF